MAVCLSKTELNYTYYDNEDCSGNPTLSFDITLSCDYLGIEDKDYNIQCCSGNVCSAAIEIEYETSTCTDDIDDVIFDEDVDTIGARLGYDGYSIKFASFWDDTLTTELYLGNDACDGAPDSISTDSDGDCEKDSDSGKYFQYQLTCKEAINTCPSSQLPETTKSQTTMESTTPSDQSDAYRAMFMIIVNIWIFSITL